MSSDFIREDSFLNIALKLCYNLAPSSPSFRGLSFFFPFSSILYYLPFISTVYVQIQIGSTDNCPINPSLRSFEVVVKAEKHGSVSCRAFNAIVAASSQIFQCLPLSYSFLILIIFHGMVRSVTLNDRPYPLSSVLTSRRGVLPQATFGVALIGFYFFTC